MKRIIYLICIIMCVSLVLVNASATDSKGQEISEYYSEPIIETDKVEETSVAEEPDATEKIVATEETNLLEESYMPEDSNIPEIDSEIANEIADVLENSESRAAAIVTLAEKLGISLEQAENIINSMLEVGDKYLGENQYWLAFKTDIQDDMQYWTTAVVLIIAILTIVGALVVLLGKTNPTLRKVAYIAEEAVTSMKTDLNSNSQTIAEMKKLLQESAEREEAYQEAVLEKEEIIQGLTANLEQTLREYKVERAKMVKGEIYNLRALKVVLSRTNLPLSDKAAIELWFASVEEILQEDVTDVDREELKDISKLLPEAHDEEKI